MAQVLRRHGAVGMCLKTAIGVAERTGEACFIALRRPLHPLAAGPIQRTEVAPGQVTDNSDMAHGRGSYSYLSPPNALLEPPQYPGTGTSRLLIPIFDGLACTRAHGLPPDMHPTPPCIRQKHNVLLIIDPLSRRPPPLPGSITFGTPRPRYSAGRVASRDGADKTNGSSTLRVAGDKAHQPDHGPRPKTSLARCDGLVQPHGLRLTAVAFQSRSWALRP